MARSSRPPLAVLAALAVLAGGSGAAAQSPLPPDDAKALAAFAAPEKIWGRGLESSIEEAYRLCFKTRILGGRVLTIRLPFAENHERDSLAAGSWDFLGKGKAAPAELWPEIERAFESADFAAYLDTLSDGKEKVIIFNIARRSWSASTDIFDIARMKAGSYHGLPHMPYVLAGGKGVEQSDVYNYLYCVSWAGMDCSACVWHVLSYTARKAGINLGRELRRSLGTPRGAEPSWYAGTAFYNSKSREITAVADGIRNLRAGDIILFRAKDGTMAHSAVIQSVDFAKGVIRYLQDTDEAPQDARGVHESFIHFKPGHSGARLTDAALVWSQQRFSPFPGEKESAFSDDGERYRAYGGGRVVRLRLMPEIAARLGQR
ncbi:MAG: peptidoglycan endopeptidase [Spirochaetaceae bacterium]|nr:peptidoglycan endopeptidase [Spirochaetaceae bacterium]